MKQNKYVYVSVVQGNYGFGWEDLVCETDRAQAKQRLREYRENQNEFWTRLITRRVPRAKYEAGEF